MTKLKTAGPLWRGFLPYAWWYALAAWSAVSALKEALPGSWLRFVPDAEAGLPWGWRLALNTVTAMVVTGWAARSQMRRTGDGTLRLRDELSSLISERAQAGVTWLNRDEHLLFRSTVRGRLVMRRKVLCQVDEDQVTAVHDLTSAGGGRIALTGTFYVVTRLYAPVLRMVEGWVTFAAAGGLEDVKQPGNKLQGMPRVTGELRELTRGRLFASPEELAEVIALFRAAEPIGPPEEEEDA